MLNCLGFRAEESRARAKRLAASTDFFEANQRASNSKREVIDWYPIAEWTEEDVWNRIHGYKIRHLTHPAYSLGMPRLSCCFCVFAPRAALIIAGKANRELLAAYVEVEAKIGHKFRVDCTMAEVAAAVEADEPTAAVTSWGDC